MRLLASNNPQQPYIDVDHEISEEEEAELLEEINKSIE